MPDRTIILVDGRPAGAEPRTRAPGGVFTTMRTVSGRVLFLDDHLERLERAAAALALPPPQLETLVDEIAAVAGDGDARVRVTLLPEAGRLLRVVEGAPYSAPDTRWRLVPVRSPVDPARAGHKTTDRRPYDAAREQAPGAHDALLCDAAGRVLECTTANVFALVGKQLLTPPSSQPLLPGIARRRLLELAPDVGLEPVEAVLHVSDLVDADACLVTNAVLLAHPVAEIAGQRRFAQDERVGRLREALLRVGSESV